jgi:hypothetical protein
MKINNKYIDFLNLNNIKYYHILLKPIENEYIIDEINCYRLESALARKAPMSIV